MNTIPDFQSIMRPLLELSASCKELSAKESIAQLAQTFQLSEEQIRERLPSGSRRFADRVSWAKTYLKNAGLLKHTRHAHFAITEQGRDTLATYSGKINVKYLKQFAAFQEFLKRTRSRTESKSKKSIIIDLSSHLSSSHLSFDKNLKETSMVMQKKSDRDVITLEEKLIETHNLITNILRDELLDRLQKSSPAFFENIIIDLLTSMGYGGSIEDAGKALGGSGDGGVDGVIDQDALGVDQIYIQCKRYGSNQTVGPTYIRDFYGALSLKNTHKGIFITTSDFTKSARNTAQQLGRIVLINGDDLTKLMVRYNIGCRNVEKIYLQKIDESFFEEL